MIKCLYKYNAGETSTILPELSTATGPMKTGFIDNYITKWNNQKKESKVALKDSFHFFVVYHSMKDLYSGNDYDFGQKELFVKEKEKDGNKIYFPVIHLTLFDVFNPPKNTYEIPDVRRYKKIIDSSIWNQYVPVFETETTEEEKNILVKEVHYKRFNHALEEIFHNVTERANRYSLAVTHEYTDLNARLVVQSYLEGAHKAISPFLFHSEQEMEIMIDSLKTWKGDNSPKSLDTIKKFKWRFLLLDDKGIEGMSLANKNGFLSINKLQIITCNLTRILDFKDDKIWFRSFDKDGDCLGVGLVKNGLWTEKVFPKEIDEVQIVIDCVPNISAAESCLMQSEYEIILLDYLLDNNEYGYQFLERLSNRMKDYRIGPNRRCFFMFISAFATAVNERLLEKGYNKSVRELWYIGDGACPTNTPYLFAYQLLLRMEHRIKDLSKESEGNNITIIDLLNGIYVESSVVNDVRNAARKSFNQVLLMRDKYHKLEKDLSKDDEKKLKGNTKNNGKEFIEMNSSLLVYSVFRMVHHFSGAFFEHLQHLVYLTAFGTIRQWEDMWEEYIFVRKELEEYDELCEDQKQLGGKISRAIRDYIINLKENNY